MKTMIATDGSPGSEQALRFVTKLRGSVETPVTIAFVSPFPPTREIGTDDSPRDLIEEQVERDGVEVLRRAGRLLDDLGVPHESVLLHGPPAAELVNEARKRRIEILVVGHVAHPPSVEAYFGSVAEKLAHDADCAVLVAPPPPRQEGTGGDE